MIGSLVFIVVSRTSLYAIFVTRGCDLNLLENKISAFYGSFLVDSLGIAQFLFEESQGQGYAGKAFHFQEFDSGTGYLFQFSSSTLHIFVDQGPPPVTGNHL